MAKDFSSLRCSLSFFISRWEDGRGFQSVEQEQSLQREAKTGRHGWQCAQASYMAKSELIPQQKLSFQNTVPPNRA